MRKISVALIVPLIAVLMVPLFQYSTAPAVFPPKKGIPFVGMSLVYYGVRAFELWEVGETYIVAWCVFKYNSTTNCVTVRESSDWWDLMEIDVDTREVVWCSGSAWEAANGQPLYVDKWIPTNIKIGSHVPIELSDAVVIGSTKLSVCGKTVNVWQLQASGGPDADGLYFQRTYYFEKKTGVQVSGHYVSYYADGTVLGTAGGHLVSTNVKL